MPLESEKFYVTRIKPTPPSYATVMPHRNYRRFFYVFTAFFSLISMSLVLLPWQQTASGYGRVIAYSPNDRQQEISAPVEGRIEQWHVFEGTKVRPGDRIVDLIDNDPEILMRLRSEKQALLKRLEAARAAVVTSSINVDRQKSLMEKGLSARRSFEQANLEYTKFLAEEASAAAELSRMEVRLSRQMTQSVKAPIAGTILRIIAGQGGQVVKAGQTLAVIIPDTASRAVEVWIPGNDLPLIREGAEVRLQFEGWPALQFSGWPSAAIGTFGGKVSLIDASDNGRGEFRLVVTPNEEDIWPGQEYLRQGVRAQGWVLLNRVSLGYELWRKFNSFPRDFPEPAKASGKSAK
jgi:multidrug efflux pump subunit AcrA (membrane-fusion protein)